jgi:hypothetical protein
MMGRMSCAVYAGLKKQAVSEEEPKPVKPSPGDDRAGGGNGQVKCMDDAPATRGMFFVILIPFVSWFLSLLPLLILHLLVVVVIFYYYTPPP